MDKLKNRSKEKSSNQSNDEHEAIENMREHWSRWNIPLNPLLKALDDDPDWIDGFSHHIAETYGE